MEQYIKKTALVAEIEKIRAKWFGINNDFANGQKGALTDVLSFIDTLEVKDLPIWERISPDTGQTTLYKDGGKSYLERFGYRIDLKDLDKLPKKNLKAQKGESV